MDAQNIRLTTLSHGGGCGCKIAPAVLSEMLSTLPTGLLDPNLLVGRESGDDAAVYKINDTQAIVATTDFFMPIVDDAFDFGRIAATNALSDVYAVGGKPFMALALVGMPLDKLPLEQMQQILAGGTDVCQSIGIMVGGGHSIDAPEPIYGLVALGLVDPNKIKRNDTAQDGDVLILGKPLGVGILSAALQKGELDNAGYAEMIAATTKLNTVGADLAELETVHALTDVTGFGLMGHLLEMCRGSNLSASVTFADLPLLPTAQKLAEAGFNTGAAGRNWASYGHEVSEPEGLPGWQHNLMVDPQTSGGLLAACAPEAVKEVLALFKSQGFDGAAVIGTMQNGAPTVKVI
ncbi:MAG: selenide, water dikinase SelD [Alphaproteobacteria bacterium]|jgi:selenide, water dikinase|nr:selenide, water dikinase SelD [Alphaproteobacteria bacterium]MBT4965096.1 selenide, water dikinase SelD [Alphaproteobacteria bacterium]MBT5160234.1 selenide, water dikinase SelD [Alphaproteobacteria bacterium]MBT6386977.1 selenide, water dikinase SelD [Alphaproteobacteria bacterium]